MSTRRFTLIELLVVVVIITILASMLLPALSNARENGRKAVCQAALKNIGTALMLYVDEHDEFFVYEASLARAQIGSYLGNSDLLASGCPSKGEAEVHDTAYGFNGVLGGIWSWAPTRLSRVRRPEITCTYNDCNFSYYWSPTHFDAHTLNYGRHLALGLNFVFVDAHVQWFRARQWEYHGGACVWPQSSTTAPDTDTPGGCIWHPY